MTISRKDVAAGLFFVAVGLFYGIVTYRSLAVGRALNMGPGYFPMLLSGMTILLGLATAIRGLFAGTESTPFGIVPWRAVALLTASMLVFAAFFRELGMFPGVFISSMIASLSSSQIKPLNAAIVSLLIAAFCVAIFNYGINLPVPIFGGWVGGQG